MVPRPIRCRPGRRASAGKHSALLPSPPHSSGTPVSASWQCLPDVLFGDAFRQSRLEKTRREVIELEPDDFGVGSIVKAHRFIKPVADGSNDFLRFIAVAFDVNPGQVGEGDLEIVGFRLKNQTLLVSHKSWAMQARAVIDAKLERHVQAIEFPGPAGFQPGEVVDAQLGIPDQLADFFEPILAGIRPLSGDPGTMAQIYDGKKGGGGEA